MEYWLILVITFFVSVVLVAFILLFSALKSKGRGNIEYIIIQSYLGVKRPIRRAGFVTLDNVENIAVFEMFDKGARMEIGTFHQKYLMPFGKGYIMFLEQYEMGRYRPYEFTEETKNEEISVIQKDFLGKVGKDKNGNPITSILKQTVRKVRPVSNNDVDFIIQSRDKLKSKLLAKEKKNSLWRTLAIVGIYVFLFLSIFINSYYNYMQSEKITETIQSQSEARVAEQVTKTIMEVLMNQTTKDVVKSITTNAG